MVTDKAESTGNIYVNKPNVIKIWENKAIPPKTCY